MTLNQIAFLVMGAAALFGAVGVVFFRSPVRAALSLVINFFVLGLIYFMLGSQMLGISQIMVYAGAIMVLFLFVVMMLRDDGKTDKPQTQEGRFLVGLVASLAIAAITYASVISPHMSTTGEKFDRIYGTPQAIGTVLFTQYVWPFEVISILLLVGIVGSIMLAKRKF